MSPRASDDALGMLAFVPWVLAHPGATVADAEATFGVTQGTIERWVGMLNFCGLPGLGGGALIEADIFGDEIAVRMADELKAPMRLTAAEALLLVLAGEAVLGAMPDEAPALRSALDKVRATTGIGGEAAVQIAEEGTVWTAPLREAIDRDRQVRFRYHRRADEAEADRTVDPWQLLVREGHWYLQAYDVDREAPRTFRLDRMVEVTVTDHARTRPPPTKGLPEPAYEPGEADLEVELELAPGARWVAEAVAPTATVELGEGRLRVVLHTPATAWLRRLLLSAGVGARVIAPSQLADEVRDAANRAMARYDGG